MVEKRINIIMTQILIFFKNVLNWEFLFKKPGKIKINTPIKYTSEIIS